MTSSLSFSSHLSVTDKLDHNNFLWAGIQGLHYSPKDGLFCFALTVLVDAESVYLLAFFFQVCVRAKAVNTYII